jgi:cephalosporin hydroxylase
MVTLDSDHTAAHVLAELEAYAPMVSVGCYLVVEDTSVNGRPLLPGYGAGPGEALDEWLPGHPEFEVDWAIEERHGITTSPGGWLRRVR